MKLTINNIFHLKKILSLSNGVYKFCKVSKYLKPVVWKFSRTYNTGFLVAGCCFSRQSAEEPLLSNGNNTYNTLKPDINNDEECLTANLKLAQNGEGSDCDIMKRKIECISKTDEHITSNETILNNVTDSNNKRANLALDEHVDLNENIQAECSVEDTSKTSEGPQQYARVEKPKKQRPNYFVAIKISDDQIHSALKGVQDHILDQEGRLENSMIKLGTLHITLMVMYINDSETHSRALKVLEDIHSEHDRSMSQNPLELEFKGLGNFQNRVLFAKLSSDAAYERLNLLAKSVKAHFESASIYSTDTRQHFTPHLTVVKIDPSKRQQRFVKKIDPSLYQNFSDHYFGTQRVESIQLLSMTNPKTETGYYSGDEIYFSAFNPSNRISRLNKLLSIEEKKKNVREAINMLAKTKLK